MPVIQLSSLVQSIAPYLLPNGTPQTGNNNSIGSGGTIFTPPNNWSSTAPVNILNFDSLVSFINDQEVNNSRNAADQNAAPVQDEGIANDVDTIIERNKQTLGLTGGVNGFYDIKLLNSASGDAFNKDIAGPVDPNNPQFLGQEPDGFRLYLIAPPKPPVNAAANGVTRVLDKVQENLPTNGLGGLLEGDFGGIADRVVGSVTNQISAIKDGISGLQDNFNSTWQKYIGNSYDGPESNSFYSVILPLPKELVDSHNHNTDNLMLSILPRAIAGAGIGLNNFSNSISKKYKDSYAKRVTGESQGLLSEFIGGAGELLGSLGAEAGSYALDTFRARSNIGLNPNVETIYATPQQRQFQFTFELYVKSKEETQLVRDFIQKVKEHSYPLSVLGNNLYIYPGEVYFEFSGKFRNKLFRSLRPCIITNIQVQYSNQDQYQHFEDGSSIVYVVSITLLENRMLDKSILVEDRSDLADKGFSDRDFRNNIKFNGTALGQEFAAGLLSETDGQWNVFNPNSSQSTSSELPTPNNQ